MSTAVSYEQIMTAYEAGVLKRIWVERQECKKHCRLASAYAGLAGQIWVVTHPYSISPQLAAERGLDLKAPGRVYALEDLPVEVTVGCNHCWPHPATINERPALRRHL